LYIVSDRRGRILMRRESGALMNAGPIIHPPLIVMNAGPIEHFERWDIHKEGTQASIRHVTDALDADALRKNNESFLELASVKLGQKERGYHAPRRSTGARRRRFR